MLQALSGDGERIILANLTKAEIAFHRKETSFFCPTCHQRVMVKSGPQTIPHFAHYPQTKCSINSHGESLIHQKGKILLYRWLQQQKIQVSLEKYIPDIQQQPDLFLQIQQKDIALEYQCSRADPEEIQQRNHGYYSLGIQPIWILGPQFFQRIHAQHLRLNSFITQFIHQFIAHHTTKIYFLCPNTQKLAIFQDIYMRTNREAGGNLTIQPLLDLQFTELFKNRFFSKKVLYEQWKHLKINFRMRPPNHLYGQEKIWNQWLYQQNTHVQYLPSVIHLPVRNQFMMKSPPWNWQSRLWLSFLQKLAKGTTFTLRQCLATIRTHLHERNTFLLIRSYEHPVQQYLTILERLKSIKRRSHQTYVMKRPFPFHQHIEQALAADEAIMDQLIRNEEQVY